MSCHVGNFLVTFSVPNNYLTGMVESLINVSYNTFNGLFWSSCSGSILFVVKGGNCLMMTVGQATVTELGPGPPESHQTMGEKKNYNFPVKPYPCLPCTSHLPAEAKPSLKALRTFACLALLHNDWVLGWKNPPGAFVCLPLQLSPICSMIGPMELAGGPILRIGICLPATSLTFSNQMSIY